MIENGKETETDIPRLRAEHSDWGIHRNREEDAVLSAGNLVERILSPLEPVLGSATVETVRTEEISEWKRLASEMPPSGSGAAVRKLYGQVNTAWRRELGAPSRGVTVSVAETETVHGVNARELDRAVQRDARRYDGQMTLL